MRLIPYFFLFALVLNQSCNEDEGDVCTSPAPTEAALQILPLGDSRVEGARPDFESYRYELWKNLRTNDWTVDLIGSRKDNASYPDFLDQCFDNEHEGTGGATTGDILNTLSNVEFEIAPEVVLLGIGGNDLLNDIPVNQALNNIRQIVNTLQNEYGTVIIFIEQIAPGRSDFMTDEFTRSFDEFNRGVALLPDVLSTENSPVIIVDMATDWSDDFMADEVHYNEEGAKEVADRYFVAIETYVDM